MNDDFTDLENELRTLKPRAPGTHLADRIGEQLDTVAARQEPVPWWQRCGFNRPLAAVIWGVLSPGLTAAAAIIVIQGWPVRGYDSSRTDRSSAGQSTMPVILGNNLLADSAPASARATNVVYDARDEGVFLDAGKEPVHRLRYKSADLVEWRNPSTGASWEVSYPREDVRLVPVEED